MVGNGCYEPRPDVLGISVREVQARHPALGRHRISPYKDSAATIGVVGLCAARWPRAIIIQRPPAALEEAMRPPQRPVEFPRVLPLGIPH